MMGLPVRQCYSTFEAAEALVLDRLNVARRGLELVEVELFAVVEELARVVRGCGTRQYVHA